MSIQNINNVNSVLPNTEPNSIPNTNTVKSRPSSEPQDAIPPSPEALKANVDKISQELKQNHVNLDFSIDKSSKEVVVKVIDSSTGDVLTQFPSKQALAISEFVANKQKGSFFNLKA